MLRLKHYVLAIAVAVPLVLGAAVQSATASVPGLNLGIVDDQSFKDTNSAARQRWFDRTVSARANTVIIGVRWAGTVQDNPPSGFDATDPADPAYHWSHTDNAVRSAAAHGLRVVLHISGTPEFAEGPNRPSTAYPQSWLPDPDDVGDFGTAIATRYSGHFGTLPRVRFWQLWAEPNLGVNISPQVQNGVLISGNHYRTMLNEYYDAVKAVDPTNFVITAGTSPAGGLTPQNGKLSATRTLPIQFWRQFFCLQGTNLTPVSCPNPPKFDAIAHHPISVGDPLKPAKKADDVATSDLWKIKRVLNKALATGRALPNRPKPFWATEIWWNSKPPVPGAVSTATQARWLAESFYLMWKQRVDTVVWFEIRDYQDDPGFPIPRCGLFFRKGKPKPAYFAYRFPFVAVKVKGSKHRSGGHGPPAKRFQLWGKAPSPGKVLIQAKRPHGKKWRTVKKLTAGSNRIFLGKVTVRGRGKLRAKRGSEKSLGFRLR